MALGLVLLLALATRLARVSEGMPYLHFHDEPAVAGRALEMLKTGDADPHWYRYGTLSIYLNAAVDFLHYLWLCQLVPEPPQLAEIHTQFDSEWGWTISHPSFYLWNRGLSALLGTAMVALCFALTRRLAGAGAGLLAAGLLAVVGVHVAECARVGPDVPAAFFVLAATFLALRGSQEGRWRDIVLAALVGGLATATKYNAACVLVVPMAAVWTLPGLSIEAKAWRCLGLPLLALASFFAAMPYALNDLPLFLTHVGAELRHYRVLGHDPYTVEAGWEHLWVQLGHFRDELGLLGLAAALLGWVRLGTTRAGALCVLSPLAFGLLMVRTRVDFDRGFLSIYPFLCTGIAVSCVFLVRVLRPLRRGYGRRLSLVGVAAGLLLLQALSLRTSLAAGTQQENRSRMVSAINRLAQETGLELIAVAQDLHMHPEDLARLTVQYEVTKLRRVVELARRGRVDAVLVPRDYEPFEPAPQLEVVDERTQELIDLLHSLPQEPVLIELQGRALTRWKPSPEPGMRLIGVKKGRR